MRKTITAYKNTIAIAIVMVMSLIVTTTFFFLGQEMDRTKAILEKQSADELKAHKQMLEDIDNLKASLKRRDEISNRIRKMTDDTDKRIDGIIALRKEIEAINNQ